MKFILESNKNKKINTQDLIKDLISVSKILSKSPTISEYNANGAYESSVIIRRFSSWNVALQEAGLEINNRQWTEIELFTNIQEVWEKKGKQPARRDMDDKNLSKISSGAYLRYFKTWQEALKRFLEYVNINTEDLEENEIQSTVVNYAHKTKRDIPIGLRFIVLKRDNYKCCLCGASPAKDPSVTLEVDHKVPWAKGGETTLDNLWTLCWDCNRGAGTKDK